jgi:hypothetical protein
MRGINIRVGVNLGLMNIMAVGVIPIQDDESKELNEERMRLLESGRACNARGSA